MPSRTLVMLLLALACSEKRDRPNASPPPSPPPQPAAPPAKPTPSAVALTAAWWSAIAELPAGTFDVSIGTRPLAGVAEASWSRLAGTTCGESDVFLIPGDSTAHLREGLRCGRAVFEHVPAGGQAYVIDDSGAFARPCSVGEASGRPRRAAWCRGSDFELHRWPP